jgi:hypothetical protein
MPPDRPAGTPEISQGQRPWKPIQIISCVPPGPQSLKIGRVRLPPNPNHSENPSRNQGTTEIRPRTRAVLVATELSRSPRRAPNAPPITDQHRNNEAIIRFLTVRDFTSPCVEGSYRSMLVHTGHSPSIQYVAGRAPRRDKPGFSTLQMRIYWTFFRVNGLIRTAWPEHSASGSKGIGRSVFWP